MVARVVESENRKQLLSEDILFFWSDENVLELARVVVTQHPECIKCY